MSVRRDGQIAIGIFALLGMLCALCELVELLDGEVGSKTLAHALRARAIVAEVVTTTTAIFGAEGRNVGFASSIGVVES